MVYMYANSLVEMGHDVSIYYWCRLNMLFSNYPLPFSIKFKVAQILSHKGPKWFHLDKRVKGIAIKTVCNSSIADGDIVIATAVNTAIPVYNLESCKGKKAYFIQDFENWEYTDEMVYKTYALGMQSIVVAKWLKDIVDQHSPKQSILISNGIDTKKFFNKGMTRPKHSIALQYRDAPYKGPQLAIDAVKRLYEIYPDLTVNVISINAAPADLPECCRFYHCISPENVAELNNCSEVFMCTSAEEGYGLPGLEAMACGCAVCSTKYKGIMEYATDGVNALLSPVGDIDTLVHNICSVFESDSLRMRLANNAIATGTYKSHTNMASLFEHTLEEMVNA